MEIKDVDALERAADQFSSAIITKYELNCSRRRGRPTAGMGSLKSFAKKLEKGSDGPRKAIRKNYGTYTMQLGMHI